MRYQRDVDRSLERKMRHEPTPAEKELWRGLRRSTFKFRRQHRINNYIADFYCHEVQLIVEVDGSAHDSEYAQQRDHERDAKLAKLGFTIVRIRNEHVIGGIANAVELIEDVCLML